MPGLIIESTISVNQLTDYFAEECVKIPVIRFILFRSSPVDMRKNTKQISKKKNICNQFENNM